MSEAMTTSARPAATLAVSVHGTEGVLDLVVPAGATSVDVARAYAAQAALPAIPLLQTALGELLPAGRPLVDLGVQPGDVLVAASGVHRPRAASLRDLARGTPESPGLAAVVATAAAAAAALAAAYAVRAGDDVLRTVTVAVLLGVALVAALPVGRHAQQRGTAAPAFAAAAAFAAFHEPGAHLLPTVVAVSALAAAVVAAVARAARSARDEALIVWIVTGTVVFAACSLSPLLGWDARVSWTLLLALAMLASRAVPALAVDVPDEALLDLDRLAVTAWSARDQGVGRRGRVVVASGTMAGLVTSATRTVTAAAAAVLAVTVVSAPLLLRAADVDLDRIGARSLVLLVGAGLLLAARSYRHAAARGLLRLAGLGAWLWLALHLVASGATGSLLLVAVAGLVLGAAAVAAAVATGRGWRSAWWARRAEVAEAVAGATALASVVVASGLFRLLWETTS